MTLIILMIITVNVLLFVLMGLDKWRAQHQQYRISERTLLLLGLLGGGMAGILAMFIFRHKTRKPKFYIVYSIGIAVMLFLLWQK